MREAVLTYSRIAEASGGLLSLKDLLDLLEWRATEEELESAVSLDEFLREKVVVESGRVLLRGGEPDRGSPRQEIEEDDRRRQRAVKNLEAARAFAPLLGKGQVLVAVGGTNSYLSAAENDDIDFYCITKTDGMWSFMLKSLMLARIHGAFRKTEAPFCFSFVMDERQAIKELTTPKGALYARDSLSAKVISGATAYRGILEKASWMRGFFPQIYDRTLAVLDRNGDARVGREIGSRVTNLFLYVTLGSYVAMKAWLVNRRLARRGRFDAMFKAWVEPGRLEYAAKRYIELGKMYEGLEKP